jgi:hypothetical protein
VARIDQLLVVLNGVKEKGAGRWIARCPAHEDRSPSLSIKELPDGRILLKCFAECDTEAVLGAVGLEFSDLFPERLPGIGHQAVKSRHFSASELLEIVSHETTVAALILADVLELKEMNEQTWTRLATAASRLARARDHGR